MTNELAIRILTGDVLGTTEQTQEAVTMAVRALLQPELIRCKDCKHGSPNGKYGCKCYHYRLYETHEMKQEDFCSKAERRTDADVRGEQE